MFLSPKDMLDTNGNIDRKTGKATGAVHSWLEFYDVLQNINKERVEKEVTDSKSSHKYEETFARIATSIILDPSEETLESLPERTKNVFQRVIEKLKEIYSTLTGQYHAPKALEEAVLSAFNRENGVSVERKGGIRYSNENNEDLDYNEKGEKNGIYRQEQGDNQGASDNRGFKENINRNRWKSDRFGHSFYEKVQGGIQHFKGKDNRGYSGRVITDLTKNKGIREKLQNRWNVYTIDDVSFVQLEKDNESIKSFLDKLNEARSGDFGYMVDSKTIEQLKDENTKVFLSEDGNAGFAIEYDYEGHRGVNNIVAVFNYGFNGSQKAKRGVYSILINAIEQGGNVLDCYAERLQSMYSRLGFVPYQKMDFNIDYVDTKEKAYWERDFQDGEYPPVCAMYFPFSSIDDFVNNLDTVSEVSSDLSNIPTATDYEEMMNGRDALVQENIAIENIKNATNAVIDSVFCGIKRTAGR